MGRLAVFDFDRTIVDDDSDATIIRRLKENDPPGFDAGTQDWTPYMSNVFEHAFTSGCTPEEILSSIKSMRANPGMIELIKGLHAAGWEVLILSDANSIFIQHWLKSRQIEDCVTAIITNRAFFHNGRLFIEPCMSQSACSRCPANLCKSLALAQYSSGKEYERVVYTGDGRNDFCPASKLGVGSTVFPRRGYPLNDLTEAILATPNPQLHAKVVPWQDGFDIIQELQLDVAVIPNNVIE